MDIKDNEYETTFEIEGDGLTELLKSSEIIEASKRFNEGKETLDDLLNNYRHLKIRFNWKNQERKMEIVELKYYKKLIDTIKNLQNELDNKDEIINAMVEEIEEHMSEEVYNYLHICDKCKSNNEECHGDYCKETIIDYFTKKAEGK